MRRNRDTSQVSPGFDWSLESVKDLRNEFAAYRKYPQDRPEKILPIISFKRKPLRFSGFRSWLRSWERFWVRVFAALPGRERPKPKDFTRYQPLAKADYLPRGFWGLILIPGPMVVAMETLFMYCPLAAEGFTLISLSINAM